MFTGLIEAVGTIARVSQRSGDLEMSVSTALGAELSLGDSVSMNGVCLTVAVVEVAEWTAYVGPETARVTTCGRLAVGQRVNLERAMRSDGRFGGHLVQGHIDTIGHVSGLRQETDAHWVTVAFSTDFAANFVPRGSVAVDGVSLTVAGLTEASCDVMVVPYTWEHTSLSDLRLGDPVNLECDIIGKYILRAARLAGAGLFPTMRPGG